MKSSSIIGILLVIALIVSSFFIIKNENANPNPNSAKQVTEFLGTDSMRRGDHIPGMIERKKAENRKQILLIGGVTILVLTLLFFFVYAEEKKKNPLSNLKKLKEEKIITEDEYLNKVKETKDVKTKNQEVKKQKRTKDILIKELSNLKSKGILTDEEYQEKYNMITNKNYPK